MAEQKISPGDTTGTTKGGGTAPSAGVGTEGPTQQRVQQQPVGQQSQQEIPQKGQSSAQQQIEAAEEMSPAQSPEQQALTEGQTGEAAYFPFLRALGLEAPAAVDWGLSLGLAWVLFVALVVLSRRLRRRPDGAAVKGATASVADQQAPDRPLTAEDYPQRKSIADRLISDRPLQPGDPDPLGFGAIARRLSLFLRNDNTQPPLTLAVLGAWGTGKSSIMSLLKGDLERYGYRPIWFNAWHHQNEEHLLAALLEALRQSGFPRWWSLAGLGFRARLFWLRTSRRPAPFVLVGALVAVQAALAGSGLLPDVQRWLEALAKPGAENLAFLPGLAAAATFFFTLQQRFSNTLLDPARAAAVAARGFGVGRFRDKLSFRHRFAAEFGDVTRALKPLKVVILIDDLDRCRPTNVLELLETVNFLVSSGDCYVVMGLDRERVLDCVGIGFKQVAEDVMVLPAELARGDERAAAWHKRRAFAEQYLEKLVNIEIPVPMLDPEDAQKLLLAAAAETKARQQPEAQPSRLRHRWLAGLALVGVVAVALVLAGLLAPAGPAPEQMAPPAGQQAQPLEAGDEGEGAVGAPSPLQWGLTLLVALAGFGALAGYAALVYRRALVSIGAVVGDSQDFHDALEIWYPLIARKFQTPRALKRFLNRMRYLAMCSRREPGDGRPPALEALDEATLVALAAAADCLPGGLDDLSEAEVPAAQSSADAPSQKRNAATTVDAELAAIVAAHRKRFAAWPPSSDARAIFHEIAGGMIAH